MHLGTPTGYSSVSGDPARPGRGPHEEATVTTATDPVCGMKVEEGDAPAKAEYQGQGYFFCSSDCKEEFEANPGDYAS